MKIDLQTYKDKVRACFLGKNIGGTLGAPFEGKRGVIDLDYYTHDLSLGVLPNDDLDLQLVWLSAAERHGKSVNADILADYWLTFIVADWSEYGMGKNNLKAGLPIGMSNRYHNHHSNSCGCFIRSEIWACLAPGRPDIAVKYAYEDGVIDHADDGLYAEIFCAALQSAAFAINDLRKLIEIGMSYIPENTGLSKAIDTVLECYDKKLSWKECRKKILQVVPSGFGLHSGEYIGEPDPEIPESGWGYDAPANVAIAIMGILYSEGDFSKAVCIAAGCCEDSDCSAGTAGALMGIMGGTKIIDEKWLVPIGDEIKTVSIDRTRADFFTGRMPYTVTDLTERIVRLMPTFMYGFYDMDKSEIECKDDMYDTRVRSAFAYLRTNKERLELRNKGVRFDSSIIELVVEYKDGYNIEDGVKKSFDFHFENKLWSQQWINIEIDFPEEWETVYRKTSMPLDENFSYSVFDKKTFTFVPHNLNQNRYDIPFVISSVGKYNKLHGKLVFFAE